MDELRYVLLTSGVEIVGSAEEVASRGTLGTASDEAATVGVARAAGSKCAASAPLVLSLIHI